MTQVIPKDTRYVPIVQQRACCVPASISMIMLRNQIPLISQEMLGYHLGLIVDKESSGLFWNMRTGKKPGSGFGTRIQLHQFDPNIAFKKLKIPLKFIFHPISEFKDESKAKSFITDAIQKNKDILVCYDWKIFNGDGIAEGHVSVVDKLVKGDKVRIVDPSNRKPKWRVSSLKKLYKAAVAHGDRNMAGFWEFTCK